MKNAVRDAADLANLPEAWIGSAGGARAPGAGHKLVQTATSVKAQVHVVFAKCGIRVTVTYLFGVAGSTQLQALRLLEVFGARVDSQLRLLDAIVRDGEIRHAGGMSSVRVLGSRETSKGSDLYAAVENACPTTTSMGAALLRFRDDLAARPDGAA